MRIPTKKLLQGRYGYLLQDKTEQKVRRSVPLKDAPPKTELPGKHYAPTPFYMDLPPVSKPKKPRKS